MKNSQINREAVIKVAKALDTLCDEVVFVGGAIVGLYIDDPAAEDIRPTKDIDLAFQIYTLAELEQLRTALNRRGFQEAVESQVICRFRFEELWVDVMATQDIGWAPGNRWFLAGFTHANRVTLDGLEIKLLPLPFFLATKFDAFFDRGIRDVYASTDLEDLMYLLSHTSNLVEQVFLAPNEVAAYVGQSAQKLLRTPAIMAAIPGHLSYDHTDEQFSLVHHKLNQLAFGLR
jgi:hypothetical protein